MEVKKNIYKIKYSDGTHKIVQEYKSIDVIRKYALSTKEHMNTRVFMLTGEQEAIARAELES